ncbi:RimK family alpha-L-glutamate ligase [Curtobacterium sp. NPDC089689]|uniref:ATP-grasp domain-containing protein n=1 Tax=Curtobacterium sp. NPDC089689 TaxID=3363968 RepID=UPI0038218017
MRISTLAWVTTAPARGLDEDEDLALAALRRTGVTVDVVDWDDPDVDWSAHDRVVLRSTWDYDDRLDEFVAWLHRVEQQTELVNPLPAVLWSTDKQYLGELADAEVPITPTTFVRPGETPAFPDGRFVVKPAVGAGSRGAAAYGPTQHGAAADHVRALHDAGQVVLVQPFVHSVPVEGEWPLVFLGGTYSHAASKRVALPEAALIEDLFAAEVNAPHVATAEQVEVARAAVAVVTARFGVLPYARVDLVRADDGSSLVLEVELVEPSLFLPQADPGAADRLAAALTG